MIIFLILILLLNFCLIIYTLKIYKQICLSTSPEECVHQICVHPFLNALKDSETHQALRSGHHKELKEVILYTKPEFKIVKKYSSQQGK